MTTLVLVLALSAAPASAKKGPKVAEVFKVSKAITSEMSFFPCLLLIFFSLNYTLLE